MLPVMWYLHCTRYLLNFGFSTAAAKVASVGCISTASSVGICWVEGDPDFEDIDFVSRDMDCYCDPVSSFVEEKIIERFSLDDLRRVLTSRPQIPRISFGQKTSPFDLPGIRKVIGGTGQKHPLLPASRFSNIRSHSSGAFHDCHFCVCHEREEPQC